VSSAALSIDALGKKYRLHSSRHDTLRDWIADLARRLGGRNNGLAEPTGDFWALKDVSFEVGRGDCVGIVGQNGAGKSTLLKILSRITEPTEGRVCIRGRVSSLLEVGTGFHPELTGRENIHLYGAILGLGRREMAGRFDAIVEFSGVEAFLEMPIKRYSSGMHTRLAFAVAAHLEPNILIVDEVLAVGDIAFQRKCLGKMEAVSREGRTVLFVSHNLTALRSLCRTGVLLEKGQVRQSGAITEVVRTYLARSQELRKSTDSGAIGFSRVGLRDLEGADDTPVDSIETNRRGALELVCRLPDSPDINIGFTLINDSEVPAVSSCLRDSTRERLPSGDVRFLVDLPVATLPSGRYRVEGAMWDSTKRYDQADMLTAFDVINPGSFLDVSGSKPRGATLISVPWRWSAEHASDERGSR
jgi:lipopolysaccharide transport system ATP-binding protein